MIRDPGFGADHVELYFSTHAGDFDGIAVNESRADEDHYKRDGEIFFQDGPPDGFTPVTRLDLIDHRVVWNLQADADNSHVKLLAAIAFDANGTAIAMATMRDFDVPVTGAIAYAVDLEPVTQLQPSDNADPPGTRVWLWHKENNRDAAACLGLEFSDGEEVKRIWLVPEDDPDCDEVELECDELYWHADDRPIVNYPGGVNCFASPTPPGGMTPRTMCKAGSRACVDGEMPNVCNPLHDPKYCVANAICNADACVDDLNACRTTASSKIVAVFPADQVGRPCADGTGFGPLHLNLVAQFTNGCQDIKFTHFDAERRGIEPSITYTEGNETFALSNFSATKCEVDVSLVGNSSITSVSRVIPLALDVTLTRDHVIMPLLLNFTVAGCTSPLSYALYAPGGEALDECQ